MVCRFWANPQDFRVVSLNKSALHPQHVSTDIWRLGDSGQTLLVRHHFTDELQDMELNSQRFTLDLGLKIAARTLGTQELQFQAIEPGETWGQRSLLSHAWEAHGLWKSTFLVKRPGDLDVSCGRESELRLQQAKRRQTFLVE